MGAMPLPLGSACPPSPSAEKNCSYFRHFNPGESSEIFEFTTQKGEPVWKEGGLVMTSEFHPRIPLSPPSSIRVHLSWESWELGDMASGRGGAFLDCSRSVSFCTAQGT